ncbi:MAG: response regulator [Oscillospiraceae bacterium]|nr:response regulator [Oscillospiraceae bacterium]
MENTINGSASSAERKKQLPKRFLTDLPHVLIVDDNAILLRTVKDMFTGKFAVSIATSSSQAFMAMSRKKPDIILLDYEMPIVNGEATLKMIREDENYKDIPVIFFTSSADTEVVKKLIALGPDGYILKPPNKEVMISQINKTLFDHYAE